MKRIEEILAPDQVIRSRISLQEAVSQLSNDSKQIAPGTLFFAIRGTSSDGHTFLKDVVQKGAKAVIIDKPELLNSFSNAVLVKNTRAAYAEACAQWFDSPSQQMCLIGITGTNGKTTSSFLIEETLKKLGKKTGLIGTVCNKIGDEEIVSELTTPGPYELQGLFREMIHQKVTHAVMEVSSIALDQFRPLGTQFQLGLFTNLTGDHLDYHGSMESYFNAKLRFFRDYGLKLGVFWKDDPYTERFIKESSNLKGYTYSLHKGAADFSVEKAALSRSETWAEIKTPKGKAAFQSPLIGTFNLLNCLGVFASLSVLGFDESEISSALAFAKGAPGRLERVMPVGDYPNIFVDYAHSDDALLNVLRALNELKGTEGGKIISVFGCGGDRDKTKRPRMAQVASALSDVTVITSDNPRTENPESILNDIETGIEKSETEFHREVNRKAAIELALSLAKKEDLVLIAGKGHETYQIIGKQKYPFDDREVVRGYYSQDVL